MTTEPISDERLAEIRAGLVKPLVWRDLSAPNDPEFLAHHCYGSYTIRFDDTFTLPWIVKPFPCAGSNFASLDEAKAAAEAEHVSRMVRELDPSFILSRLDKAEAAIAGIVADWDKRGHGRQERYIPPDPMDAGDFGYWSPNARMVGSQYIANARACLPPPPSES